MPSKTALAALICVFATTTLLSGCFKDEDASQEQAPQAAAAPLVGIVELTSEAYPLTTDLPGRTSAYRIAEVRPQVNGIIQKRLFKEGSDVKANDQLYQIDPAIYKAAYQSAQANEVSTRSLVTRYADLVKEQAVSRQSYDDARANHLQAQANLERARIDLAYTKVLAPISGRIGRSYVTEGALVTNGQAQEMAVIQQLDPIYVDVTQPARQLLELRRALATGQLQREADGAAKVTLQLDDGTIYEHEGRLEFSEVSVDETTGSVTLRAIFPNPDHVVLPGMFVNAKLAVGIKQHAILAPQQGISRNPRGDAYAMVVGADNKVEQRMVTVQQAVGNRWLVSEGLQAGDRLIVEGLQFIKPGIEVTTKPADNLGTPEQAQ